ncbi:hypothetical protein Pmar_PMAR005416 [Perkinsus marinus ATCC 50983]|uniref:Uncharacterized protein n=1 Tax=Perkinsus marinus (strain ATCC 50983 / TXsc) TaxID=423536 RepID=C5KBE6_PERM5|nr:hypothetical protein Pmar_PMAR005416 [Perkinsus marinus ATCC 50983]EER18472.1 hypothetical protein Pmar_PMAR005416 [Perkinsus marinus ATCC 50983]|eukprot:XP_002786676.1 hypothetical protein Pmar_PMAR005416 [Perkinsus marinus ATCC 50983]
MTMSEQPSLTPKQRALLSALSAKLLEQYKGRIEAEEKEDGERTCMDPISRWIGSTPGAMDLLVQLSEPSSDEEALGESSSDSPHTSAIGRSAAAAGPADEGPSKSVGGLSLPVTKHSSGRMTRSSLTTVPEQATMPVQAGFDISGEASRSTLLDDLVNELVLLLANTPWMCASLAQLLPLLSPTSKDLVRQQQVTQSDLISASEGDLTLVTGTDILVYTGSVEKMAALLQSQGTLTGQQVQSPLAFQQQQQQAAIRLQAAHAAAAGGGGGISPGMSQGGLARPIVGPGQTQPKRGVLNMETLSASPQLAALIKEVSFLLLTAGGSARQLLLSELGTRISAQSRMFLKLNRTRLGQLLLRFPKDFLIEGQRASGKVTLIRPEIIQCPSTPVPLEKDIVGDSNAADDTGILAGPPPGMSENDTQSNIFSQAAGNYYAESREGASLGMPSSAKDNSVPTLSSRSVGNSKSSRLADLGMGLSVDVAGSSQGAMMQQGQRGAGDNYLYMAPQQLVLSPLPLVSPGTALGLTPFSAALPRSMAEGVLQTPVPKRE